jgi:hypothetical protein
VKAIAPTGSLEIHEEAWNAYPYCKVRSSPSLPCTAAPQTVVTNPGYMKENFRIVVETYHLADRGDQENVHELDKKALKDRSVVNIDIAGDPVTAADYKKETDPCLFTSSKTGRGPLQGWVASRTLQCWSPPSAGSGRRARSP